MYRRWGVAARPSDKMEKEGIGGEEKREGIGEEIRQGIGR
jgi:hypothetical protein